MVKQHSDEIMTRQNVQSLLDLVKNTNAAIVRELVPDLLSLGQVHKVLQTLVKERVSIRDLSTILERLADYTHVSRDTNYLQSMFANRWHVKSAQNMLMQMTPLPYLQLIRNLKKQ